MMPALRSLRRTVKRALPRTLFARTLLIIATPAIIVQAIATFIFYDRHWSTLSGRLASGVAGEVAFLASQLEQADTADERQAIVREAEHMLSFDLAWLPGVTVPRDARPHLGQVEQPLAEALSRSLNRPFLVEARSERTVRLQVQLAGGALDVRISDKRLFSPTTYIFILWMLGSAVVLFAIAALFMRNQVRPIRRLADAAERFGRGQDAPGFRPEGATEVRQAAAAFIEMRDRLRRQIQQRTEMLAGVSHDLRTPLTRMRLQLAFLPASRDVEELKSDIAEMETMIEGYLAFARGEGGEPPELTDVAALIGDVVEDARRASGVVELTSASPIVLPLRPTAFRRGVANLVGNAVRYAGRVWVAAGPNGGHYEIVVDDDGPGIPPERRDDVFRPFFRLEESRNRATGGVGLGLTIARDVARTHGGDVLLGESPQGGLRAILRVPI